MERRSDSELGSKAELERRRGLDRLDPLDPLDPISPEEAIAAELEAVAAAARDDRRALRTGFVTAAALLGLLLAAPWPERADASPRVAAPVGEAPVFLVERVRLDVAGERRPRAAAVEPTEPAARRLPIPEPAPDAPEPIRIVERVPLTLEVPLDESIAGIPAAPPSTGGQPEGPIPVGGDVRPPEKIYAPQPVYSEVARRARVQGIVIVQAIIDREGNVTNIKVLNGLPMGLDAAAVEAMKHWKFRPATLNGRPVTVYYNLTVNFKLQ